MKVTQPILGDFDWDHVNIEDVLANSYKDLHVKGVDYLCLRRDPLATVKAYFFEDGIHDIPDVVNPHDHRYNFLTECVSGLVRNKWFTKKPAHLRPGLTYSQFSWDTPLNGGNGFQYSHDVTLWQAGAYTAGPGSQYAMSCTELHTIQVLKPETCIAIVQGVDRVPVGTPTQTFIPACGEVPTPPCITGLYNKFKADEAVRRIELLKSLTGKTL